MATGPALAPYSASSTFGLLVAFLVLSIVAVALRFQAMHQRKAALSWPDWTSLAALGFLIIEYGISFHVVLNGGLGYHASELSPAQLITTLKWTSINQYFYILSVALGRASVILFTLRIFSPLRWFKISAYTILAIHAAWFVYAFIIVSVVCIPYEKQWYTDIPGTCRNLEKSLTSFAYWAIAIEVLMWSLPLPALWSLQMSNKRQRIGLTLIFLVGLVTIAISIARVVSNSYIDPTDITAGNPFPLYLAIVEPAVIIIVGCLPVYRVLLDSLMTAVAEFYTGIMSRLSQSRRTEPEAPSRPPGSSGYLANIQMHPWKTVADVESGGAAKHQVDKAGIRVDREVSVTASKSTLR